MTKNHKSVLCFAHGTGNDWEAICVDFDIAVQGSSFSEVQSMLNSAIADYVEDVQNETPAVREKLLTRRAPWYTRLSLTVKLLVFNVFDGLKREEQASFPVPCPA